MRQSWNMFSCRVGHGNGVGTPKRGFWGARENQISFFSSS